MPLWTQPRPLVTSDRFQDELLSNARSGELGASRTKGTPGFKIEFAVIERDIGRRVWHDCWLTPAAIPQSKRDFGQAWYFPLEFQDCAQCQRCVMLKCRLGIQRVVRALCRSRSMRLKGHGDHGRKAEIPS